MSEWPRYYILVGRVPFAVDLMTWGPWFNSIGNRRIGHTDIAARCHVSTVFLGLDHNFRGGEPILFETMIFGGPLDGSIWRYHTYDEAERGHADVVAQTRIACARVKAIADAAGVKAEG